MQNIESRLVNAQQMARDHPDTFQAPALSEMLRRLTNKYFVKVCIDNKERFWVQILKTAPPAENLLCYPWTETRIVGTVANELVLTESPAFGDIVTFGYEYIYDFISPDQEMAGLV